MSDADRVKPAASRDFAHAIAFALRFEGRKRVHQADDYMAQIAAERVVRNLERAGFVVMKKPSRPFGARGWSMTDGRG